MFISTALAQTAETAAQAGAPAQSFSVIFQMVLLFAVLWFVLIRPQQKRIKKHEAELKAIIKGTRVVVAGLVGKVVAIENEERVVVEFTEGVQVPVLRAYISQVLFETPMGTPKKERK